jgi:hypothetical protein
MSGFYKSWKAFFSRARPGRNEAGEQKLPGFPQMFLVCSSLQDLLCREITHPCFLHVRTNNLCYAWHFGK